MSDIVETPAALPNGLAAQYIGTTPNNLKLSRCTGELYKGVPGPAFVRCGRKILYLVRDLDDWLGALPRFKNSADYRIQKEKAQRSEL